MAGLIGQDAILDHIQRTTGKKVRWGVILTWIKHDSFPAAKKGKWWVSHTGEIERWFSEQSTGRTKA